MAPASNEEQFKFLISCIRYSNNGKVDFGQVAKECKIVSKGAAAKRYERMMRSHGIAPNAATIKTAASRGIKTDRHESTATSKKRKAEAFMDDDAAADDEEEFASIKPDPIDEKKQVHVKEEAQGQLSMGDAADLIQYYEPQVSYSGSPLGGGEEFAGSEYDTSTAGYATPMGSTYGLQDQQSFNFENNYDSPVMNSVQGGVRQDIGYQSLIQYTPELDGRPESPVVVE